MRDRVAIVIQVRMRSQRLPGKALADIGGLPLLHRLCRRMALSQRADQVIVATSDQAGDDVVEESCRKWNVPVFRGPHSDLVRRLLGAARVSGAAAIGRVTADNPLTDPDGLDQLFAALEKTRASLVHNKHRCGLPYGTGAEVMTTALLEHCAAAAQTPEQREDFVTWIRSDSRITVVAAPVSPDLVKPDVFLTVDYPEDLTLVRSVYRRFDFADDFELRAVLQYLDAHPEVAELNQHLHTGFVD